MPNEVKLDNIIYHTPIKEKGYHKSLITYDDESILLQTPPVSLNNLDNGINLTLNRNKKHSVLYNMLRSLEVGSNKSMSENSKVWFGKHIPLEKIQTMFKSCLVNPETLNGSFNLRLKKDKQLQIYNSKKQITTLDELKKGVELICILKINGILFGKNTAKIDIRVVQVRVCPEIPKLPKGCNVIESDNEESGSDYDSDMDDCDFNDIKNNYGDNEDEGETTNEVRNEVRNVDITVPTTDRKQKIVEPPALTIKTPIIERTQDEGNDKEEEQEEENEVSKVLTTVIGDIKPKSSKSSIVENEFQERLLLLRKEMKDCVTNGDLDRIEEIACEIVQLKNSNTN